MLVRSSKHIGARSTVLQTRSGGERNPNARLSYIQLQSLPTPNLASIGESSCASFDMALFRNPDCLDEKVHGSAVPAWTIQTLPFKTVEHATTTSPQGTSTTKNCLSNFSTTPDRPISPIDGPAPLLLSHRVSFPRLKATPLPPRSCYACSVSASFARRVRQHAPANFVLELVAMVKELVGRAGAQLATAASPSSSSSSPSVVGMSVLRCLPVARGLPSRTILSSSSSSSSARSQQRRGTAVEAQESAIAAVISGAVSSTESAGRPCRACSNLGSTFTGRSVKLSSSLYTGSRVRASAKPEDSDESDEPAKNPEEKIETIQGLKAETDDKEDADLVTLTLDDVNPVGLGRRTRQIFDSAWRRLTNLGQLTSASLPTDEYDLDEVVVGGPMCDFQTPNAELTTVLVAGATGRVGRVLVRKLQLRGYKVKALVRKDDEETLEKLPRSVQIVVGDVGDSATTKAAVEGCNKIIFCATARSSITGDLTRVDHQGVYNLSKAFQDYNHKLAQTRAGRSSKSKLLLAKFSQVNAAEGWELREGFYFTDEIAGKYDGGMDAQFEVAEDGNATFSGYVFTRGGYVELAKRLSLPPGLTLDRYEGLVLSVCGDGKAYTLLLETDPSEDDPKPRQYFTRFPTRLGYSRVRIPFSSFRPMDPEAPPLDPFLVHSLAFRFEPRRQRSSPNRPAADLTRAQEGQNNSFKLILDYIKALPSGQETDFILVSCSGAGVSSESKEKVLRAKQAGEGALRNSGLGYTIIRPGPLQEEPGGQRALVFDQGDRITQSISCADVADVCVKSLHNPTARNKSFDVCYEYIAEEGLGLYELVAHLPDKSNNYLTPALAVLERNT